GRIERGLAFPTSISLNEIACNYSPLEDDLSPSAVLKAGDVVKVEVGVHVDGYIATLAHTIVLNPNPMEPVTGRTADVVCAAYYAAEAALRFMRPGNTSTDIINIINMTAQSFNVNPVPGTASHMIKRYLLEAEQAIPNIAVSHPEEMPEELVFGENEVYSINIFMSTGTGSISESPHHETTILQRDVGKTYNFKLAASRLAFNDISKTFGVFPFSMRALLDINPKHRLGIKECLNHEVIVGRPVLSEMPVAGENVVIAHYKMTVLILPSGPMRLTTSFQPPFVHSLYSIDGTPIANALRNEVRVAKAKLPVTNGKSGSSAMEV
ncbi:hypothetical protein HDU76_009058, partial [Blyttiomyces sp. JEL0837]